MHLIQMEVTVGQKHSQKQTRPPNRHSLKKTAWGNSPLPLYADLRESHVTAFYYSARKVIGLNTWLGTQPPL